VKRNEILFSLKDSITFRLSKSLISVSALLTMCVGYHNYLLN